MYTMKNILSHSYRLALTIVLSALLFSLQPPGAARAATITVTNLNDSGAGSLRQAIADAVAGDTIDFSVTGTITLTSGELAIAKNLTITGPSAGSLTISGNNASRVFQILNSTVTISNVTITNGNSSPNSGGGIQVNNSTLTLNNSTVSGNTGKYGGGVIVLNGSSLTINNSTISGNTATSAGGGVADDLGINTININNSTISGNTSPAATGGGLDLFNGSTTTTLSNTIVANSITTTTDCYISGGTLTSGGYNLVEKPGICSFAATGDITGQDPLLLALADNGGPTWTHALNNGSPAIEQIPSGTNGCGTTYTTDQRGEVRPGNRNQPTNRCEIGAWEAQVSDPTAVTLQSISANSNTPALSRVEVAILPALSAIFLLALMGGVALRRRL